LLTRYITRQTQRWADRHEVAQDLPVGYILFSTQLQHREWLLAVCEPPSLVSWL